MKPAPGIENECADLLSRWGSRRNNMEKLVQYVSKSMWLQVNSVHMYIDVNI